MTDDQLMAALAAEVENFMLEPSQDMINAGIEAYLGTADSTDGVLSRQGVVAIWQAMITRALDD